MLSCPAWGIVHNGLDSEINRVIAVMLNITMSVTGVIFLCVMS